MKRFLTVGLTVLLALASAEASAVDGQWGKYVFMQSVTSNTLGRLCTGMPSGFGRYFDIACAANAPFVSSTSGYLGVGTVTPTTTLEVSGTISTTVLIINGVAVTGNSTAGLTSRTLTGNITLFAHVDTQFQMLSPGTADRTITLSSVGAVEGDVFEIMNTHNDITSSRLLSIQDSGGWITTLRVKDSERFVFLGSKWVGLEVGGSSTGYGNTAYGGSSSAYKYGSAFGYSAVAQNWGAAAGIQSQGYDYGTALGGTAQGQTYGVGIGFGANGFNYSVSIGANAGNGDVYSSTAGNGNVLLGYGAGYSIATALNLSNTLVIANNDWDAKTPLIYGRFDSMRVGIGTTAPNATLDVSGTIRMAGTGNETCGPSNYGTLRVNPVTRALEMCRE